jgi:quercetin dioxygenase-like cupin family protein
MSDSNRPIVAISCVSNVFIKQMTFAKAGDLECGHSHIFDHVTLLASGKLRLTALGKSTEFTAPHHIFIKAGVVHELLALEDLTVVHCIHALRDGERVEDIIDPESIPAHVEREAFDESAFYPMTHELKENLDAARAA